MKRAVVVVGTSLGVAVAMLALLLAALSISFARWEGVAFYGLLAVAAFALVAWLMRRERRARAPLAPRRVPRQPIRLPVRAAVLTFAGWYLAAVAMALLVNGRVGWPDLAIVAPFASFLLSVLTLAGRHIAFRLTAEEEAAGPGGALPLGRSPFEEEAAGPGGGPVPPGRSPFEKDER